MRTMIGCCLVGAMILAGCGRSDAPSDMAGKQDQETKVRLTGAGATFPQPLYEKWISEYTKAHPEVQISYNGIGSGGGIKQISSKEVDFGASDAPMNDKELQAAQSQGQDLQHLPMTLGAVVAIYNLEGIDQPLRFTGPVLADLFSGKISKWNDPRMKELNPGAADKLPDAEVKIVHRDDPSGTTYVFTEYLSKVSPDWKPAKSSDQWPKSSQAGKGNARVADAVKAGKNTLGYVELNYALANQIDFGDVQNKSGKFIRPGIPSVSVAAQVPQLPEDLSKLSLTDTSAADGYPISATTFLLVPRQIQDSQKAKAIAEFVRWCMNDGQKLAASLYYAPLPENLAKAVEAKLSR